jgi:predicted CXXCH cytochrome family protein
VSRHTLVVALRMALVLAAALAAGCHEEQAPAPCPTSGILLDSIYATDDSVAVGATVHLWALPEAAGQQYSWSVTAGRIVMTQANYAQWKAPDVPALAKITVVAVNAQEESRAISVPIAVETYLPRHEPTYAGASYCGSECHAVETHGESYDRWVRTAHANAYPGLEQDPLYHEPCALCHTVGFDDRDEQGWSRHNAGYDEVPVARLQGVQCENCHGPLSDRYGEVLPDHGDRATGAWLLEVGTPAEPTGCARCHENTPLTTCSTGDCHADAAPQKPYGKSYLSEWQRGAHDRIPAGVDLERTECVQCHTAQGYIEKLAAGAPPMYVPEHPLPITCAACHDPHGSGHLADLRVPAEQDICGSCHTDEDAGYPAAPHAPQAQLLAGTGGYEYGAPDLPSSPHASLVLQGGIDHRGCVHCHYDEAFARRSHSFRPDPVSCEACHPGANGVDFDWSRRRAEITNLLTTLRQALRGASPADSLTEAFRRAEYNYLFVERDGSRGSHNYRYARALLDSSLANFPPRAAR